jgi:TonB-linked SusC/RagA family outer membrane protein
MKKIYMVLPLFLLFFSHFISAQEKILNVQGKVIDDRGELLIGVNVFIEGTTTGIITDINGRYSINVKPGDRLTFTYVGCKSQTVTIIDQTTINITMESSVVSLEDVVVVGYGKQKKESVVGAIVQASGEDIIRSTTGSADLANSLSGMLSGVTTQQRTGKPGEFNTQILIRAQNTWNSTAPLVLVDGVERDFNESNPHEIERISVLKDASATAVFGVKGGNGVILITTKRGTEGKSQLSFDVESTLGFLSRLPETANTYEGIKNRNYAILNELALNNSLWGRYVPSGILEYYRTQEYPQYYQDFDWRARMLKDFSKSYKFNLDASGGTKFVKYFTSVGYQYEGSLANTEDVGQGYNPEFRYDRFNFRTNLDFNLTKSTVFSVQLSGYLGIQKQPPGTQDIYVGFFEKPGDDPIFQYEDGTYGGSINPYSTYMGAHSFIDMNLNGQETDKRSQLNNDFVLQQDLSILTKGLSAKAMLSYDNSFYTSGPDINVDRPLQKYIDPAYLNAGPDADIEDFTTYLYPTDYQPATNFDYYERATTYSTEDVSNQNSILRQLYYQFSLNYDRTFGNHSIGALALMSRQETTRGSNFTRYREDWVGRINYDYKKIYLFETNAAYN